MATYSDRRRDTHPVWKVALAQMSWGAAESAAQEETVGISGCIRALTVRASDATNAITYTVTIYDENNAQIWSQAGIAENANTTISAINRWIFDNIAVEVTPSGVPGNTATVDVTLYGE